MTYPWLLSYSNASDWIRKRRFPHPKHWSGPLGTADYCDLQISRTTKCSIYYGVSKAPGNSLLRKLGLYLWSAPETDVYTRSDTVQRQIFSKATYKLEKAKLLIMEEWILSNVFLQSSFLPALSKTSCYIISYQTEL